MWFIELHTKLNWNEKTDQELIQECLYFSKIMMKSIAE